MLTQRVSTPVPEFLIAGAVEDAASFIRTNHGIVLNCMLACMTTATSSWLPEEDVFASKVKAARDKEF